VVDRSVFWSWPRNQAKLFIRILTIDRSCRHKKLFGKGDAMDSQSLVFEYFFQIGAGATAGIACVLFPGLLVYRFILSKIQTKRRNGEMD